MQMQKRGLTLMEMIIVVVIIGILASLGFAQYSRMVERSHGAEARTVLGGIRTQCAGLWITQRGLGSTVPVGTFTTGNLNMGSGIGDIPTACATSGSSPNYCFRYDIQQNALNTGFQANAYRCTSGGKNPWTAVYSISLITDFAAGTDQWVVGY